MTLTKEKIKEFLRDKFDVTIEQMYIELSLKPNDRPMLEVYLEKLIKEKWVTRSITGSGYYEYDPGKKQNFGGIK